jgi:hypothetical protein
MSRIDGGADLLESYVADLERQLADADPAERADIVASVREHVAADLAALGRPATPADVEASLTTLGSVDAVVAAWTPERSGQPATEPRRGLPTAVVVAGALAALTAVALVIVPIVAVPLAVTTLVAGIVALRRHREGRAISVVATALGGAITLGAALVVLGLMPFLVTSHEQSSSDVVSVPAVSPAP